MTRRASVRRVAERKADRYRHAVTLTALTALGALVVQATVSGVRRIRANGSVSQAKAHGLMMAAIVDSSDDAIISKTLDGTITSWNHGAERMYGYRAEEAVGRHITMIVPSDKVPELHDILHRLARGQRVDHLETRRVCKNGTILDVSITISPLCSDDGIVVGASAVARDVGERKRLEARERALAEQSSQAERLQSLGQLAGGVAHDFNNYLAIITNYAELVRASANDEEQLADIGKILGAGERAAELIHQMLAFAREEPMRGETFDLSAAVTEASALLSCTVGQNIEMVTVPSTTPVLVHADRSQIQQVLMNLAINARDAMPAGGTMSIEACVAEIDEESPMLQPPLKPGLYGRLLISDTGDGIPANVLPHIFDPFFTTKPPGKGTGLGLATVSGIVADAGGTIKVYSEPQLGTTFRIYLPLSEQPEGFSDDASNVPPSMGQGERILVVEDDPDIRQAVERILLGNGYSVETAGRGEEALRLTADDGWDLLLTDVVMPGMTGPRLAHLMRRRYAGISVLFMSGYSDGLLTSQGLISEPIDLVQKPFSSRELLCGVARALAAGPSMNVSFAEAPKASVH